MAKVLNEVNNNDGPMPTFKGQKKMDKDNKKKSSLKKKITPHLKKEVAEKLKTMLINR